jgi:type VI secretion system secreted protein VgrG
VRHEGASSPLAGAADSGPSYENRFQCVPAHVTYASPRTRRRNVQACLTATVVAPGDEIHVDAAGQIKVQFHWDRDGRRDGRSSCWIRVMQPWAGAGWGSQFIPRAGMEVVVGFDGGDPDRPIVLGSVYNAVAAPPFPLPESKTRSGIRTRSTPNGGGRGNELSFEDASGREQVHVHAERDLDVRVRNDRTLHVDRDDHTDVRRHRSVEVHGDARAEIHRGDILRVGGDRTVSVANRQSTAANELVEEARSDRRGQIGGCDLLGVAGASRHTIGGDAIRSIGGHAVEAVGSTSRARSRTVRVEGTNVVSSSGRHTIASDSEVVLACGRSFIRLTPERIEITSPEVVLSGECATIGIGEEIWLETDGEIRGVGAAVRMSGSGSCLSLDADARLEGGAIQLQSPDPQSSERDEDTIDPTVIELRDDDGNPMANRHYRIQLDDGTEQAGMLDDDGRATVTIEGQASIVFEDLAGVERG